MRSFQLNLQANVEQELGVVGNHFRILEATNDLYVSIDDSPYFKVKAGQGLTDNKDKFERLKVKSLVAQNALLIAGFGTFHDSNESISVTTSATVAPAATYNPLADVSVPAGASAALVSANLNRLSLIITNPTTNTATFRLGVPLDVSANKGAILEVGDSITLATTAAISAFNTGAVAESLVISELVA